MDITLTLIQSKIYEVRGQKVMLDFDLAEMYQVETRILNQSVKRNQSRFPAYVYTVKTGDTLMSICKKHYGTTTKYTEVLKYNELDDANVLYVGQEIKLP